MRRNVQFILLISLLVTLSACTKEGKEEQMPTNRSAGIYYGEGRETLTNLPPEAVLLKVNGASFTKHDFDIDQAVYGKMMAFLKNGKMNDAASDIRKLQAIRAPKVLNMVIRRELLNQEAHKRGLKASKEAINFRRQELEDAIRMGSVDTNNIVTIEELAERMGAECGKYFLDSLERDAENLELSWLVGGQKLQVSEDEVTAGSNRLAKANALVTTTNSILTARLTKALERIKGGEDFAKVGEELTMFGKEEVQEWGIFSIADFESTDYPDMVSFLEQNPKPGTVAGPFQCDDGVSIVKVLSVIEGGKKETTEDDSDGSDDARRFRLARISVETFEQHKPIPRTEIKKILENTKRQKMEAQYGKKLFVEAVIEFPSGTNLFIHAETAEGSDGHSTEKRKKKHKTHKGEGENVY